MGWASCCFMLVPLVLSLIKMLKNLLFQFDKLATLSQHRSWQEKSCNLKGGGDVTIEET